MNGGTAAGFRWYQLHAWDGRLVATFFDIAHVEEWVDGRECLYKILVYRDGVAAVRGAVRWTPARGFRMFSVVGVKKDGGK